MSESSSTRRDFLQQASGAGAGALLTSAGAGAPAQAGINLIDAGAGMVPRKPFGRHRDTVSILGVGGAAIGSAASLEEAVRIVHEAIDAGVNFFDNAWEYQQGRAEERMGRALEGRRDRVFLMTKVCTHGRDARVAMQQLEESLRRLRTDHLDLWQVHECIYDNDADLHFARGGVIEALDQAKRQGKVRYVGFTGHKHPLIHLRMLSHGYPFDAVQMPLNCFDATYRSFERLVLPELRRQEIAALGMKSLGGGGEPLLHGAVTIDEALRYAMSLPVATTISGMDSLAVLQQNLEIARNFQPLPTSQMQALRDRCAPHAGDGHLELYKSSVKYDGDLGRSQHGYPSQREMPV